MTPTLPACLRSVRTGPNESRAAHLFSTSSSLSPGATDRVAPHFCTANFVDYAIDASI